MNFVEFARLVRFRTRTNTSTLTDADILLLANTHKDSMTLRILGANENYFGDPSLIEDLVADTRQYDLDATIAGQISFVSAKLDGEEWVRLTEGNFNIGNMNPDEASIQQYYTGRKPQYVIFGQQLWILSEDAIIDVVDGLKVFAFTWPKKFTDLSLTTEMDANNDVSTHGWPREFQELLADRVVIDYKSSQDKPVPLTQNEQLWEQRMKNALAAISNANLDRSILAEIPAMSETGEEV